MGVHEVTESGRPRRPLREAWQEELATAYRDPRAAWAALRPGQPVPARLDEVARSLPVRIPRSYARLIDPHDPADPLARMVLPDPAELVPSPHLVSDPLGEEPHTVSPRLVHRYRDRALLLVTLRCASYCRHCTRRRAVGRGGLISREELAAAVRYLREHPEIRDLLVSGGDPLLLPDRPLGRLLETVRQVQSLDLVRIGSRIPAVLPARVTPALVRILARVAPLFLNTHFNHPRELTAEAVAACGRLVDAGIPLANQTVLLAGVNDSLDTLEALCRGLLKARVRPYYLLQSDLVQGVEHLRTPLARGIELIRGLQTRVSGMALPVFVVDGPFGTGKIPIFPDNVVAREAGCTLLRSPDGGIVSYSDPLPPPDPLPPAGAPPPPPPGPKPGEAR